MRVTIQESLLRGARSRDLFGIRNSSSQCYEGRKQVLLFAQDDKGSGEWGLRLARQGSTLALGGFLYVLKLSDLDGCFREVGGVL